MTTTTNTITVSAYSEDYSEKAYKFYFGLNSFEFVPKSQVKFLETMNAGKNFETGIKSRFFEMPLWLANRLKGSEFYTFL